ncbi:MAG: DUF4831 family protein [Prevotellaceae bacterium]|jgi:hypothetical protein|nr:DUF4831 family protein [Prevotellaceae bacterium]
MKKRNLLLSLALLTTVPAAAQTEVTAGITRGKEYGVTYILPKTEIVLTVQTTRHTYTPGEFARYAERYLRMSNVSTEADTYWTLDKVETAVTGVPDRDNVYFVRLKDKTVAPLIELTKDGIVCSVNMPLGSAQQAGVLPADPVTEPVVLPESQVDPRSFLTEEILMANSTAKMAELVAKEIYTIRDTKNALTRGDADNMPKDGEQLKVMLANLTVQEHALTALFLGKSTTETVGSTFRVVPKEMKEGVPFRFSQKLGVLPDNDLAGEPVYLTIADLHTLIIPPAAPADGKKTPLLDGVAYKVPGRARLTVSYQGKLFYDGEISVTQFGVTEYLAASLFNKNSVIKVLFNPVTGGLLKVDRE